MIEHGDREATSATPLIELEGVTKTYRTGELAVEVLHGIDLAIHPGEFVAIVGARLGQVDADELLGCSIAPTTAPIASWAMRGRPGARQLPLLREAFCSLPSYNLSPRERHGKSSPPSRRHGPGPAALAARSLLRAGLAERASNQANRSAVPTRLHRARAHERGQSSRRRSTEHSTARRRQVPCLLEDLALSGHTSS